MKTNSIVMSALACLLATTVFAQDAPHHGGAPEKTSQTATSPAGDGQGMKMGSGMMGGMGPGMMGGGMGMGPCGMGGMMPGLGDLSPENQQKYLNATKELRKKLNDKQFEYAEAARNPKADRKELLKKRKEMWEIQHKIHEQAWGFMDE